MHDFKRFPELTNNQMQFYYWESPHKQIFENFRARVTKVIDGDTIRVMCDFRNFDFPIRLPEINAPELDEEGGIESARKLGEKLFNREIEVLIDTEKRVEKFYRAKSRVIYPPVAVDRFIRASQKNKKEDYFLIVSRLVGAKGLEEAVIAAKDLGFGLKIVGGTAGYETVRKRLEKIGQGRIEFLG